MRRYTMTDYAGQRDSTDRGRGTRKPGSGNEQSGRRLALSHEQTKSKGR